MYYYRCSIYSYLFTETKPMLLSGCLSVHVAIPIGTGALAGIAVHGVVFNRV